MGGNKEDFSHTDVVFEEIAHQGLHSKDHAEAAKQVTCPPCSGTARQRHYPLSQWEILATPTQQSGDVFFATGVLVQLLEVKVGSSFETRGARNDSHDVVAACTVVPLRHSDSGAPQPATRVSRKVPRARGTASRAREPSPDHWHPSTTSSKHGHQLEQLRDGTLLAQTRHFLHLHGTYTDEQNRLPKPP